VKNSLQIVASLLNLQSRKIKDDRVLDLFYQSRDRVKMMASVYEELYQSESFARINFKEYLKDVMDYMYQTSDIKDRVALDLNVEDVEIGLNNAIPVALILNELLTNSIKHAFPNNREGKIEICFKKTENGTFQLIYRDSGIGLPKHIDFEKAETLGLHLIKNLAHQIEGQARLEQNEWTAFKIKFKGYGYAE
jgi:two-component sensor histidine kinase